MYEELPEHRRLRTLGVECMRGGHILCEDGAPLDTLVMLGAVRVLRRGADAGDCSVPSLFPYEQREGVAERLAESDGEVPDVFVLRDSETPIDGLPSFVRVGSASDLERALRHNPYLLVAENPRVVREVKAALAEGKCRLPVYLAVEAVGDPEEAYAECPGPDGLLIARTPTEADMRALYQRQAESIPSCASRDGFTVGVLAHQGDYELHIDALQTAAARDVRVVPVGMPDAIRKRIHALVLPGGWSKLQGRMMDVTGVADAIREFHARGGPILAVCAGMILARRSDGRACDHRIRLDLLPVVIDNNELNAVYPVTGWPEEKVFSNAPVARPLNGRSYPEADAWDPDVRVISRIASGDHRGKVVAVQSGNCLGFAFHEGIHDRFLEHCRVVA